MNENATPRVIPPISDELIERIETEISNTHVTSKTTELEAGFMLGVQHALAAIKRYKNGGVLE